MTIEKVNESYSTAEYRITSVPADYNLDDLVKEFHIFAPFGYNVKRHPLYKDTVYITAYID